MFKALGRIRKDNLEFDVMIKPLELNIRTSQPMAINVQIQRGK